MSNQQQIVITGAFFLALASAVYLGYLYSLTKRRALEYFTKKCVLESELHAAKALIADLRARTIILEEKANEIPETVENMRRTTLEALELQEEYRTEAARHKQDLRNIKAVLLNFANASLGFRDNNIIKAGLTVFCIDLRYDSENPSGGAGFKYPNALATQQSGEDIVELMARAIRSRGKVQIANVPLEVVR